MRPSLPLAQQLADAVLDQVERDGGKTLHKGNIATAILARLCVIEHQPMPAEADAMTDAVNAAERLIIALAQDPGLTGNWNSRTQEAYTNLYGALRAAGRL